MEVATWRNGRWEEAREQKWFLLSGFQFSHNISHPFPFTGSEPSWLNCFWQVLRLNTVTMTIELHNKVWKLHSQTIAKVNMDASSQWISTCTWKTPNGGMGDRHESQNCVVTMSFTAKATQENGLLRGGGGKCCWLIFAFITLLFWGEGYHPALK